MYKIPFLHRSVSQSRLLKTFLLDEFHTSNLNFHLSVVLRRRLPSWPDLKTVNLFYWNIIS